MEYTFREVGVSALALALALAVSDFSSWSSLQKKRTKIENDKIDSHVCREKKIWFEKFRNKRKEKRRRGEGGEEEEEKDRELTNFSTHL